MVNKKRKLSIDIRKSSEPVSKRTRHKKTLFEIISAPKFDPVYNKTYKSYTGDELQIKKIYKYIAQHYSSEKNVYIGSYNGYKSHIRLFDTDAYRRFIIHGTSEIKHRDNIISYHINLVTNIKKAIAHEADHIFVPVVVRYTTSTGEMRGHASMLIIYPRYRMIILFEPVGTKNYLLKYSDKLIRAFITKELKLGYTYYSPDKLCLNKPGPQRYERLSPDELNKGYCMIFSILFMIYTLELAPTICPREILARIIGSPRGDRVRLEIRRYTNFILSIQN